MINAVLFDYCKIHFAEYDVCFRHVCGSSDSSRFTALLNSGCEVSKQKQKIVFGMDSLGWISS